MKSLLFFIRLAIVAGVYAVVGAITKFLIDLWMGPVPTSYSSQNWRDTLGRPSYTSAMIFFAVSGAVPYAIFRPKLADEWWSTCVFSTVAGVPIIFFGDALIGLAGLNPAGNSLSLGYAALWTFLSLLMAFQMFPPAIAAVAVSRVIFSHFPLGSKLIHIPLRSKQE